jgi:hypothetical protein
MRVLALMAPGTLIALLFAAPRVLAQATSAGATTASAPPAPSADRGGDTGPLSGYRLAAPLRLSLEASVVSRAGGFPNCVSREDAAGNSVGGIPIQRYAQWRLTPRLVLSGFSQGGCPIDAGIGGVFTYVVPLRPSLQLVLGAGIYAAPGQLPLFAGAQASVTQTLGSLQNAAVQGLTKDSPVHGAVRVDLVWPSNRGGPYTFGVESFGGKNAVKFGAGF